MAYGNDSISMLKGPDRVRMRPGVIFGSDSLDGCEQAFFEILSNSIDEAREGFGSEIQVVRYSDNSIKVVDHGRGVPIEMNEKEQRYNWELVFCEMYAGGKYHNEGDGDYEFSLGLNGLGTCSTQYASSWMDVVVKRDGFRYDLHFEKGYNKEDSACGYRKKKDTTKKTGTSIHWLPDLEVFTEIDIPQEYFLSTLNRQAIINPKIKFTFKDEKDEGKEFSFYYESGIEEYIAKLAGSSALTAIQMISDERVGRDRADARDYKVRINMGFCFSNANSMVEYYHNSSWLEYGGTPDKAVRTAFVSAIDSYLKKIGKYTKNESKITAQDVFDSLIFVSNCFSTQASYENQTKKALKNKFVGDAMHTVLKDYLETYLTENRVEAAKIADQVLLNKRSREHAEKSKLNIRKKLAGSVNVLNRINKFVDCRTRDPKRRELYIVEGDSALGSCKQGRDAEFQALMPIRGKILNCLKADYDKVFKSDIIVDLLKIFGCGVEIDSKKNKVISKFSLKDLKYDKIIICTDADVDGYQIRTLVLTMIYRLVPTLIREGHIYIVESPLYEITYKSDTFFAFDEQEKSAILKKLRGKKISIQRSKGLGENDPEMMWNTTMNPETRRLIQVSIQDAKAAEDMFNLLLGDNLPGRKEYISDHGEEYLQQLDLA